MFTRDYSGLTTSEVCGKLVACADNYKFVALELLTRYPVLKDAKKIIRDYINLNYGKFSAGDGSANDGRYKSICKQLELNITGNKTPSPFDCAMFIKRTLTTAQNKGCIAELLKAIQDFKPE
jgi:hypothetical protein